jgi:hypothetical protein
VVGSRAIGSNGMHVSELVDDADSAEIRDLAERSPQEALSLLRMCYSPKITHLVRSVEPKFTGEAVSVHDNSIWDAFRQTFRLPNNVENRLQSGLRSTDGGMGLTPISLTFGRSSTYARGSHVSLG